MEASILTLSPIVKGLFAASIIAALAFFSYSMYRRLAFFMIAQKENRFDDIPARIWAMIKYGFAQYKMPQEFSAGLLHIFIFVGFMTLTIRTTEIAIMGITNSHVNLYALPGIGRIVGRAYGILKELVVIGVLIGCAGFAWRRLVSKPKRMQGIHHMHAVMILGWITSLMLADMLLEGGYQAFAGESGGFALGAIFTPLFGAGTGAFMWKAMVLVHTWLVLGFLNYLPYGKHFHVLTAIPNVFFARTTPAGHLEPITDIEAKFEKMETDPSIAIGISKAEDLTWKQMLDIYTCTECGRCVPFCPAFSTDKPLSLRDVNIQARAHLWEKTDFMIAEVGAKAASAESNGQAKPPEWTGQALTTGAVSSETVWSCTLCGDCEERCPVLIEQVPRIVKMRQYMTMILSDVSPEIATFYKNVERNSNPWGLGQDKRGDWIAKAAEEGTPVRQYAELSPEDLAKVEYCFYVGCMGSYDDRAQKVTRALCKILNAAGVSYAVLGAEELCNGETARRLGNEYLGQMLAVMNIQSMMMYGIRKIVAFCPHCFNTLKNEFGDFIHAARQGVEDPEISAKYEGFKAFDVIHANDLVRKLIADGRLNLDKDAKVGEIAYHDPCFLGRYNDVFDPQREMIELAGGKVKNPSLARRNSYCCGAGGGRMWMEEHQPRVNTHRFNEILESCPGAKTVGVSCPFCMTMLTDALKEAQKEEEMQIKDVLEIVADRLRPKTDA